MDQPTVQHLENIAITWKKGHPSGLMIVQWLQLLIDRFHAHIHELDDAIMRPESSVSSKNQ